MRRVGTEEARLFAPLSHLADHAALPPAAAAAQRFKLLLVAIGGLAIAMPLWLVLYRAPLPPAERLLKAPKHVVAKTELPPVEPVKIAALSPDQARAINASIPFSAAPNPRPHPFHLPETAEDAARAVDCLAAAVLYEAGDDAVGQRAVAQVVINRVRHPAFPKTICGVVFQGAERSTGCQFTFTCDGALLRHQWSPEAWARARLVASSALNGSVFAPVGYATHYHTDWVVPYWSASLDKITAIGSHLFFRWTGWWGTPPAFNRNLAGGEPIIAALAPWSPAHAAAPGLATLAAIDASVLLPPGKLAHPIGNGSDVFLVTLDKTLSPDAYANFAVQSCGDRPYCKLLAWKDRAKTAIALPLTADQAEAMSFSYLRDRAQGFERALWNCAQFERPHHNDCMKRQLIVDPPAITSAAPPAATITVLDNVSR